MKWIQSTAVAVLLAGCASQPEYTPIIGAEPAADSVQTRMPRTLRLYYDALPDVDRSSLRLTGPDGEEIALRGLHTMAADDLMIEIMQPLANGSHTVHWTTVVGADPAVYSGELRFQVQVE